MTDIAPIIRQGIELSWQKTSGNFGIVAFGGLLAFDVFRAAFLRALSTYNIVEPKTLLINLSPPAPDVLKQRQRRGRPHDKDITLERVEHSLGHVEKSLADFEHFTATSFESAAERINSFLRN